MKSIFLTTILISTILFSTLCFSQSTNCGDAVSQLQNYASQVNHLYSNEYWTVIPNQRCPAVDIYGRPFNSVIVQNCRNQWLYQLNTWYSQQANYVNNMYVQIVRGCTTQPISDDRKPAPKVKRSADVNEEIDTEEIEELTADLDESKAVRITIPKTASGFRKN